ncbi:AAA family ATPase [Candidatus Woesearchaeota archaeon]|nr:AAA family ATPase [Candidatus Woesearchaeota archaeon]
MKLLVLYGPPGVGKHTVAKKLATITGYKLFHNHYVVDLLLSIFTWGSKPYLKLGRQIWELVLTEAVKNKVNFILTYVYSPEDNPFIKKMIRVVKKHNGTIHFIKLECAQQELHKRVRTPQRRKFKKLRDVAQLTKIIRKYKLHSRMPFEEHLTIDTTDLSAQKTAQLIKKQYRI